MLSSRFLQFVKPAVLITLIGLSLHLSCDLAPSQAQWKTYTSPDKTFLVEGPAPLREVASFDGEHGASLDPDQEYEWARSYAVIEADQNVRFGLNVINGRLRDFRSQPRAKLLWYLSAVLIGDEDNPDARIQKRINVNGLKGNEYFHIRENKIFPNGSTGEIHTRGRIFDRGNRIYVVTFIGRDAKELTSADAERFLNSFRLLKRSTGRRHRPA
jgi:hypothetical protein